MYRFKSIVVGLVGIIAFPGVAFSVDAPVETVRYEGQLECLYGNRTGRVQMIKLRRSDNGDTVKLVDFDESLKEKCHKFGSAPTGKLAVEGVMSDRFLLWGGNLQVSSVTDLAEPTVQ